MAEREGTSENFIKGAYVEQGFTFFLIFCFMLHFEKSFRGGKNWSLTNLFRILRVLVLGQKTRKIHMCMKKNLEFIF